MGFKRQFHPLDTYYIDHYWITYIEPDCSNCVHHMILCNEDILGDDFDDLKGLPLGEDIEVEFSGHLKPICELKFDQADVTFERITLTSIERH